MTDTLIDMAPFLARHARNTRRTFIAMLSASLILSAVIYARAVLAVGVPGQVLLALWMPVVQGPLTIAALRIAGALYGRNSPSFADGRFLMNADDARNVERVANAGAVFVTGFGLVMIAGQVFWLLWSTGFLPDVENWGLRATLLAIGVLVIYFGNVSPRLPMPRAPEAKPAVRMKYNRLGGWLAVLLGLLLTLAALFLPFSALVPAVGGLSISSLVVMAVAAVLYRNALKSPRAR